VEQVQLRVVPEWLKINAVQDAKPDAVVADQNDDPLLCPIATEEKQGAFEIIPSFSFDSVTLEEGLEKKEDKLHFSSEERLGKIELRLRTLKNKLTAPFLDIDASYAILTSDVVKLHNKIKVISGFVGNHGATESISSLVQHLMQRCTHLDEARASLTDQVSKVLSTQEDFRMDINNTMEDVAELQAVTSQNETWISAADKTLETFRRRFNHIKPLLAHFSSRNIVTAADELLDSDVSHSPSQGETTLARKIQDLEEKLRIIENRVVGAGVQLGSFVFQSFDDLLNWVRINVPKGRFGLFVDGHSFLEFFTLSGHIDTEAGTAAFSNLQKAGFHTYIEAQLAISFKNLFPSVFGKGGSASLDDSECLPAISNGDKWNNGSTGLHHQLMRNMNDVSYQLDSSIKKVLKDHQDAKQLAIDCVTASKRFVIDLITFMSQEYSTWKQRGFSSKAAWQIVCQIVRRIFEDLQSARISARNVTDWEDTDFTTASFIYATLKCHDIMEAYVKHQFHAHPHASSVITRHLAANFVKPDQSTDAKFSSLDAKVSALASKLDSLTSKLNLYVDKEKEKLKNDKERTKYDKDRSKKLKGRPTRRRLKPTVLFPCATASSTTTMPCLT
jgi:hypothetical protein